jgi:hypothetical protein
VVGDDAAGQSNLATAAEDFDRAAGLGLDSLRVSVEWGRIEPEPGLFDVRALVASSSAAQHGSVSTHRTGQWCATSCTHRGRAGVGRAILLRTHGESR